MKKYETLEEFCKDRNEYKELKKSVPSFFEDILIHGRESFINLKYCDFSITINGDRNEIYMIENLEHISFILAIFECHDDGYSITRNGTYDDTSAAILHRMISLLDKIYKFKKELK